MPTPFTVGHNDAGYLPLDTDYWQCDTLQEAVEVLLQEAANWFSIELDGEELTRHEFIKMRQRLRTAQRGSNIVLRGHVFWVA